MNKNGNVQGNANNLIAITGYSYRLPGGLQTDGSFWRLLSERQIVQEPVTNRYGRGFRPIGNISDQTRFASPYEGLLRDNEEMMFDRSLFGISQHEFLNLNPQVRMMLSCAWEAFEHAGWDLHRLRNSSTGVFIGAQTPAASNWRGVYGVNEYSVLLASMAMLANRVSYHFNLMGSSMTYCTACSAALSALHSAINAIRCGDCDTALVGSVSYLGSPHHSSGTNVLGVLSPDGKCYSFDVKANGYMRSEGCFAFTVKPLLAAERDGDHIFAVVEATSVNSAGAAENAEGLTQGRYITAPTRQAQIALMKSALLRAGRQPQEIDYVEAHATGTVVGDRIEGNAIADVFGQRDRREALRISSVKSNIGHLEAAAFHASLLKVILMMERRTFAPISKNFFEPNPEIDFESCPMQVQTRCEPFPDRKVVIGINSFGFGGANGHCVLSEYRPRQRPIWSIPIAPNAGYMFPLSARTVSAIQRSAEDLCEYLSGEPADLYTLAGNLALRRTHFAVRTSFSAFSRDELTEKLRDFVTRGEPISTLGTETNDRRLAMVFAGQGTQWAGCGQRLYSAHPVFRRVVDVIEEHWRKIADFSLREACFFATQEQLDEARITQPVIFMIQCALVELLKTRGVYPDVVLGHSSGEVAAAYASGALSLSEATQLIYHRGQLQQRLTGSGRMLAVGLDSATMRQQLDELSISHGFESEQKPQVEFACFNSPASVVICGEQNLLQKVMRELEKKRISHRLIAGNIAFHSSAMDKIKDDLLMRLAFLDRCALKPDVPFVSSVTGSAHDRLDSAYWWSNARQPVRFDAAMETVQVQYPVDVFLEISPHRALLPMVAQCLKGDSRQAVRVSTLLSDTDDRERFNEALGELYQAGVQLDFQSQFPRTEPVSHRLPGHPQDRQPDIDPFIDDEIFLAQGDYSHGPLIGCRIHASSLSFASRLSAGDMAYLEDHSVHHRAIMPAAGFMEIILEAFEGKPLFFDEIEFMQACPIPKSALRLQTELEPRHTSGNEYSFSIASSSYKTDADREVHCRGNVKLLPEDYEIEVPLKLSDIDTAAFQPAFEGLGGDFYDRLEATLGGKFQYGPHFRTMRELKVDPISRDFLFDVQMDERFWNDGIEEGYVLPPPLVDGALQVFLYHLMQATDLFAIPRRARRIVFLRQPTSPRITVHVTSPPEGWYVLDDYGHPSVEQGEKSGGNMRFYDSETGELFLHVQNYIYFTSNPNWINVPNSKHRIVWQPKFMMPADDAKTALSIEDLDPPSFKPESLIAHFSNIRDGEPRALHVAEFAGDRQPEQTILQQCVDWISKERLQIEYWMVSGTEEQTQACFEAFQHHSVPIRFATWNRENADAADFGSGLLRKSAAHLLLLSLDDASIEPADWIFFRQLAVAGGYALVRHAKDTLINPAAGWSRIRADATMTLLQAPQTPIEDGFGNECSQNRLVVGNAVSLASAWKTRLTDHRKCAVTHLLSVEQASEQLEQLTAASDPIQAVDIFVAAGSDDLTGELICTRFVEFIQMLIALRSEHSRDPCVVRVITQNAVMRVASAQNYTIWGVVRSMAAEIGSDAQLEFRLVDVNDAEDLPALEWLAFNDVRERELAVRDGRVWAPRMVQIRDRFPRLAEAGDTPYQLTIDNLGQINGLRLKTYELPQIGDREIEVDIESVGLNFRDVTVALGMLPPAAYERSSLGNQIGIEASGFIRRIGKKVHQHKVGDRVLFNKGGCVANRSIVCEELVHAAPANLTMDESASVLTVYMTAYYALIHLARLESGQRVLIHSAMGGVGQAAMALARRAGAEIYATAGSDSKRSQLLNMGAHAVFDSHSFSWHDELMRATRGEGVDVVLNSLAGHHLTLCLQSLKSGGYHCEIGKLDIYSDNSLGLYVFRNNLRFAAIDLDRLNFDDPDICRLIAISCLNLLKNSEVKPVPVNSFELKDYSKALRLMITGQHQGKLTLRIPRKSDDAGDLVIADRRPYLNPEATYFVTGGFGGFGLKLLPYLAVSGARHITMMDSNPQRGRTSDWVRQQSGLAYFGLDIQIKVVTGDVSIREDVESCIAQLNKPLKGVFHLAGVLDDHLLADISAESIAQVFAPKAHGALNLHEATLDCDLDHFIMFSSVSSVFGNVGQTNYSAASAYLDGLAAHRRCLGLPALTYNMAGINESGMVARDLHVLRMLAATGMPLVSNAFAIRNLDYAMREMANCDHLVTAVFERPPWTAESGEYMRSGRYISNQDSFLSGSSQQHTMESVMAQISNKVAELCGYHEGSDDEPLSNFGLTSVSVAELGAFIQTQFNCQISALELMTTSSCRSIASVIIGDGQEANDDLHKEVAQEIIPQSSVPQHASRKPSKFSVSYQDHFPAAGEIEISCPDAAPNR